MGRARRRETAYRRWMDTAPGDYWNHNVHYQRVILDAVRSTAGRLLPGVRYRRHLLWRYSLIWLKPT